MTEGMISAPDAEPRKSRTWLIVVVVVAVLCVCCAGILAAGWFLGDPVLEALQSLLG
jgi:CHASE2 domain-containing sensor protein